ncbi:lysophospholipid acyltransferase family protein [Halotalea alkalilenta]|uniref:lysophospholipid acyltransferase family protein n=1 Tax=Halotalea alkalilenta TaxID=376489 RepID=UPI000487A4AB|nr:lipid A biosynthesis acyltransferase [Halotalea alkalilenta]
MPLKEKLNAGAIRALWKRFSRWTPARLWRLARIVAPLYALFATRERRVTRQNLRQAYPHLDESVRREMAATSILHSVALAFEVGFVWRGDPQSVANAVKRVEGFELFEEAQRAGRGVIVLAPHIGNWEMVNFWLSSRMTFTAMYDPPRIAALDGVIRHGRERMGATLVPTNARGVASLLKALHRAEAIGILPDQVPDWGSGKFADFFGHPAYTATLLPKLVARTNARVVVGTALRRCDQGGFSLHFIEADPRVYDADEAVAALGVNKSVERAIALAPTQYQWEYKRYKRTPGQLEEEPGWKQRRFYRMKKR